MDQIDTVESPADSAPATVDALDSLSKTERDQWELTGEFPVTSTSPTPADSDPATPVDQAASTDAHDQPDSEPGEPGRQNAGTRKAQLAQEIQDLLAERAALRQETLGLM